MTYYLDRKFPGKVFSVPIVRFKGEFGQWEYVDQFYGKVPDKPKNSIEEVIAKECQASAFIDFKDFQKEDAFWMHVTSDDGIIYKWKNAFDSLFFIYEMKTDTRRGLMNRVEAVFPN